MKKMTQITTQDCSSLQNVCADSPSGPQDYHLKLPGTTVTDTARIEALVRLYIPETVTEQEWAKYVSYGSNWTYLAAHLARGLSTEELGILLYIEKRGRNRPNMIYRLIGALMSRIRDEFRYAIEHDFESRT